MGIFSRKMPPMSKSKSKTISVTDAAAVFGVGRSRVLALINAGRLPAVKVSTIWTIQEKDLERVKVRKPGRPSKAKPPAKPRKP
jgi:excisionase family DNA binding protein